MSLRIAAEEKSLLVRAAAIQHANLTEFVIRTAVANAKKFIELNERQELSKRDSLQVMDMLENPPEPNEKLMAVAFAMPRDSRRCQLGMKSPSRNSMIGLPLTVAMQI